MRANMADWLFISCFILLSEFLLQTYAQEIKQGTLRKETPLFQIRFSIKHASKHVTRLLLRIGCKQRYTLSWCRASKQSNIYIFSSVGMKRHLYLWIHTVGRYCWVCLLFYLSILYLIIVCTLIYTFKGKLGISVENMISTNTFNVSWCMRQKLTVG